MVLRDGGGDGGEEDRVESLGWDDLGSVVAEGVAGCESAGFCCYLALLRRKLAVASEEFMPYDAAHDLAVRHMSPYLLR